MLSSKDCKAAHDMPTKPLQVYVQVLARDVAYDLIPFAQRRGLHARLAEALETTLPRASATTIAFHYSKSCHAVESTEWKRAVKAIQYWEMAAEEAMEGIDHHQVIVPQLQMLIVRDRMAVEQHRNQDLEMAGKEAAEAMNHL